MILPDNKRVKRDWDNAFTGIETKESNKWEDQTWGKRIKVLLFAAFILIGLPALLLWLF